MMCLPPFPSGRNLGVRSLLIPSSDSQGDHQQDR